jgi:glycosyltransferase involved in cell wall biosynthesis
MMHCTVSVINDLVTDQRVRKVCYYLAAKGVKVQLIGRVLPDSPPLELHPYEQKRMRLIFTKGPLFYAFFNFRLFFKLLFAKSDLLVANDLDTLLPNFIISKMKGIPLIYDSHELFTEVPELEGRLAKKVWLRLERGIFPHLTDVLTVNDSIAQIFEDQYAIRPLVVRNLPEEQDKVVPLDRKEFELPADKKLLILQGSGINVDRGAEELVEAMKYIENTILLIVGSGDVLPQLKQMVLQAKLEEKVKFIPRQNPDRLKKITAMADVGLSIDKDTNLNYRYSLPNKLFDYIQCGVPVLASNLPEVSKIVLEYQVGRVINHHDPKEIAHVLKDMLDHDDKIKLAGHLAKAARELNWQANIPVLNQVYNKYIK